MKHRRNVNRDYNMLKKLENMIEKGTTYLSTYKGSKTPKNYGNENYILPIHTEFENPKCVFLDKVPSKFKSENFISVYSEAMKNINIANKMQYDSSNIAFCYSCKEYNIIRNDSNTVRRNCISPKISAIIQKNDEKDSDEVFPRYTILQICKNNKNKIMCNSQPLTINVTEKPSINRDFIQEQYFPKLSTYK